MTVEIEPTDKEVAAAQATLARKADADAARAAAQLAPLKALVEHEAFAPLLEQARTLFADFPIGTTYGNHLNAMVVGMGFLQRDIGNGFPPGVRVEGAPPA